MDSYLLKSEETSTEALLVSIPTTSELFSKITPHESTFPEQEATLAEDLKNFRFEEALYCATNIYGGNEVTPLSKQFLNKKDLDSDYIKSESSEEFGDQSIYRLKENISLDSPNLLPEKIILLDGHHRFAAINKHYIKVWNEVPIIFVNFNDLSIGDHYFFVEEAKYRKGDDRDPAKVSLKKDFWWNLSQATNSMREDSPHYFEKVIKDGHSGDYDYVVSVGGNESYYFQVFNEANQRDSESRFLYRDELLDRVLPYFMPSKPPHGDKSNGSDIFFAAKAPTKEELQDTGVEASFPPKSTWITPKFNPDLYREYLN